MRNPLEKIVISALAIGGVYLLFQMILIVPGCKHELNLYSKGNSTISITDSLSIIPHFTIENDRYISVVLRVKNDEAKSADIKSLDIEIKNNSNLKKSVLLERVVVYELTKSTDDYKLTKSDNFDNLAQAIKKVHPKEFKSFMFRFQPDIIEKNESYTAKVTGTISYQGNVHKIDKEIRTYVKKELVPERMMN